MCSESTSVSCVSSGIKSVANLLHPSIVEGKKSSGMLLRLLIIGNEGSSFSLHGLNSKSSVVSTMSDGL